MANIAVITYEPNDSAATKVVSTFNQLGHVGILYSQDNAISLGATYFINNFELIVCPRLTITTVIDDLLLQALQSGTPVITGTYTGIAGGGGFSGGGVLEITLGLTKSVWSNLGSDTDILVIDNELNFYSFGGVTTIYNSPSYMYGLTPDGDNTPDYTLAKDINDQYLALIALNEGYSYDTEQPLLTAKYISFGGLYGRGGFTSEQVSAFGKMISWITTATPTHEIKGTVTLDSIPTVKKVIAVSNDPDNPELLGSAISDHATGEYSITTTYDKPVMVFTMQDYGEAWQPSLTLELGDITHPTADNGYFYRVTKAGNTGTTEPTWPTEVGAAVTDGSVIYTTELLLKPEIAGYKTPTPIS